MKRTFIDYQKKSNGKIEIIDIRNIAGPGEVRDEFGNKVARNYRDGVPRYYGYHPRANPDCEWIEWSPAICSTFKTFPGDVMSAEKFQELIETLKAAGNRLQKIKDYYKEAEVRRVTI